VLGIPASLSADEMAKFEAMGANIITVSPGNDYRTGETTPIPETAPAMIGRIRPVRSVVAFRDVPNVGVFRNDKVPEGQTGGISTSVAEGDMLATLQAELSSGHWFDEASTTLPTVVLGDAAARRLNASVDSRVWIDRSWWAVIGILRPMNLASQLDATAFLAPELAAERYPDSTISSIYISSAPGKSDAVRAVMAATVNPANPRGVGVSGLNPWYMAQNMFSEVFGWLALGLGGIALLVGGIGIANTMVVSVMERRGEIGLRRALGARTGQVATQFVLEAAVIGLGGGILGVAFGAYVVFCFTNYADIVFAIPPWLYAGGPGISVAVGMLAGLYPALKAARQSPTVALRTV
jgi:putative ABC transport system permease protein